MEEQLKTIEHFLKNINNTPDTDVKMGGVCKINESNELFPDCMSYVKGSKQGQLFLVIESNAEHKIENPNIFKLGITRNIFSRMSFFNPYSRLVYLVECPFQMDRFEKEVVTVLKKDDAFIERSSNLYEVKEFEGPYTKAIEMIQIVHKKFYNKIYEFKN